jgi:alginate O-acetyltransferase complex protein AlgI
MLQEISNEKFFHQKFEPSDFIFIIGISYISFKMMHFVIEGYRQQLSNVNFLSYLNYIFFFPSFISGPINRFNHFSDQLSGSYPVSISKDLKIGFERIIHGFFKKFVICTLIYPYAFLGIKKSLLNLSWPEILLGLYTTALYFYFDFSAYSDIAIGSSRIMGLELPENFNNPFLKRNLQQLWANWHISLTSWLTDYIYWPLSKKLRNILYLKKHPVLLSNISIIITFIICGMWHGESLNFFVWGLYHGVGLAFLKVYQTQKRKIKNQFIRKYFISKYSQLVGILITFHYFVLGMVFFTFDMQEILKIICSAINLVCPFSNSFISPAKIIQIIH